MSVTPKSSWPWVRTQLHFIFDQPDTESVVAQYDRVLDALSDKLPKFAEHLDAARADLLAFTAFPKRIWRQIRSPNPRTQRDPLPHRRRRGLTGRGVHGRCGDRCVCGSRGGLLLRGLIQCRLHSSCGVLPLTELASWCSGSCFWYSSCSRA
jgi:mutator family transposase